MSEPLLLILDANGRGQAVMNGRAYRVENTASQRYSRQMARDGKHFLDIKLTLVESLDEETQRRRIAGLEAELERERERLDEIRAALDAGEDGG